MGKKITFPGRVSDIRKVKFFLPRDNFIGMPEMPISTDLTIYKIKTEKGSIEITSEQDLPVQNGDYVDIVVRSSLLLEQASLVKDSKSYAIDILDKYLDNP
jgi:hypothetical protein